MHPMIPNLLYHKGRNRWTVTDEHTKIAYRHLRNNYRAGLFLEMSLGKTMVTLSWLHDMVYVEACMQRVLVIAPPKVAASTWQDEAANWRHVEGMRISSVLGTAKQRVKALRADADIFVISESNLVWLEQEFWHRRKKEFIGMPLFDCVVIDEISMFKNQGSERWKSLQRFIKHADWRVGLTGTPTPNGLHELWAEMMLLDDGARLGPTEGEFLGQYFIERGNGMITYEYIPRPHAEAEITAKIADIVLTMKTKDWMALPPVTYVDEWVQLDLFDMDVYNELEREMCVDFFTGTDVTVKTPADLSNKLLQIAGGAIYDSEDNVVLLNTAKMDRLCEIVAEGKRNLLVAYKYRHERDRILAAYPQARQLRKGAKLIEDIEDWNAGRIEMLVLHPASAGHGLNLQFGGSEIVWFGPTWSLEHWLQTNARLIRRGAVHEILVRVICAKGTRDAKAMRRLHNKEQGQASLMNEIKELRAKYEHWKKVS